MLIEVCFQLITNLLTPLTLFNARLLASNVILWIILLTEYLYLSYLHL